MWAINNHQSGEEAVFTCLIILSDSPAHIIFCTSFQVGSDFFGDMLLERAFVFVKILTFFDILLILHNIKITESYFIVRMICTYNLYCIN